MGVHVILARGLSPWRSGLVRSGARLHRRPAESNADQESRALGRAPGHPRIAVKTRQQRELNPAAPDPFRREALHGTQEVLAASIFDHPKSALQAGDDRKFYALLKGCEAAVFFPAAPVGLGSRE